MYSFWALILVMGIITMLAPGGLAAEAIKLPPPATKGGMPLADAIQNRRTVRQFASSSLNLTQVSQLLWEADGAQRPPRSPDLAVRGGNLPPGPLPGGRGAGCNESASRGLSL
jgi:hypothetical protein